MLTRVDSSDVFFLSAPPRFRDVLDWPFVNLVVWKASSCNALSVLSFQKIIPKT